MSRKHADYERLVAAHLLRTPQLATAFQPLLEEIDGMYFGNLFVRGVVMHSLSYFKDTGRLLPPASLKTDAGAFAADGASPATYDMVIDDIFAIDTDELESSKEHVVNDLVRDIQVTVLSRMNLADYITPAQLDRFYELVEGVRTLGATVGGKPRRLDEGMLDDLREPVQGVPTGIEGFDTILPAGGIAPGETLIYFGRYSIGKSIALHHSVRHAAQTDHVAILWSFETSERNTRNRLLKGMLNADDAWLREFPDEAHRQYMDVFGEMPLYVQYSPPGSTKKSDIITYIDRVEQDLGRKVQLRALDYSEKRADGRDWNTVADAYQELREICGEREMSGIDVAQENTSGGISYSNLLKDADIGVQLTCLEPTEWRRRQNSQRAADREITIPTEGPLYGEIIRCREGKSGDVFEMWVNRATGNVIKREYNEEE